MKHIVAFLLFYFELFICVSQAQDMKAARVPAPVKTALIKKYPEAKAEIKKKALAFDENGNFVK